MGRTPQCFACHKFARAEDCVLLRNKSSGNRRWFHKKKIKPECWEFVSLSFWEEVDPSLGETTEEEERESLKGLTWIVVLIIVAILGILAAVVVPELLGW